MVVPAAVAVLAVALLAVARRVFARAAPPVAHATIADPENQTTTDERGAMRSVQAADIRLPADALERLWTPMHLERLARTYWLFLSRCTLGLIRVKYERDARLVVLLARPLVLLRFSAPEYEMDADRGRVRWQITSGLLVARDAHGGDGLLQIDVRRCDLVEAQTAQVHIEVEVANFYPALAAAVARWFYMATQSRLHVLVTHGFLRSLARLDLAESAVGRLASHNSPVGEPSREGSAV